MSRSKRRGDNTAPALFPFLAVLLCTIGALVLILVLTVANSHASAKRSSEDAMVDVKDTTDLMQVVSEELEAQRDELKAKVERRRRDLAGIEDHIARLSNSLDQLVDKIERIQSQASLTEKEKSDKALAVQELKKEIDQKKKELIDEIEKQKKRKPAFAVIPYVGSNGTSRRPVYLECTKEGVVVQPEGLLISLNDLRPPLGPGNPLDAALRVLRLTYQQKDLTFGITQPPYPLLIVRPDGIQTYAMAREAMSGWDDQFGYELVDGDMELKFPPSPAGLKEQLTSTVEVAKRRQQALIASMPRRVVPGDHDDNWDTIDALNGTSLASNNNSPSVGTESAMSASQPKEWQLIQSMASSQVASAIQRNGNQDALGQAGNASIPGSAFRPNPPNTLGMGGADLSGQFTAGEFSQQSGRAIEANMAQNGNASRSGDAARRDGQDAGQDTGQAMGQDTGQATGKATGQDNENGNGNSNGARADTAASNSGGAGNQTSARSALNSGSVGDQPMPPGANAFSSGTGATGGASSLSASGAPASTQTPTDPAASPNVSLAMNKKAEAQPAAKHVRPEGDLKPISVSAGHGWAASRAEGKATPVSRSIVMIALKDRWLLRSDEEPNKFDLNVTMEGGPQQAGNELAAAMRKRVDSWGLSVPGGYWSPTLTIEAANDAQQSVARLERLLEGSGVQIRVVPLTIPNRR
jgi:hypothetical protein